MLALTALSTRVFFLMIRRPPRSTLDRSSAASDVYKRQLFTSDPDGIGGLDDLDGDGYFDDLAIGERVEVSLSLIHISEPTRPY